MILFDRDFSAKIINGDKKAFDLLFRVLYSRLLSFTLTYVRDKPIAENMVQDAFLLLWERRETLHPDSNIQAWLLTVVKNNALNHINRQKRQVNMEQIYTSRIIGELDLRISSLKACDPEAMFSNEVESIIQKVLESLPEQGRKVIIMSRFDDMSNKEIAEKLGITIKGVEYHITKILKLLRTELKDYLYFLLFFMIY